MPLLAAAACVPVAAWAQGPGTPAGTRIDNSAILTSTVEGTPRRAQSNTVSTIVAERLDVALTPPAAAPPSGDDTVVAALRLTNAGNGREAFAIAATLSLPGQAVRAVAIDRDGDGRFDPAVDDRLDGATPALAPGETVTLLIVVPAAAGGTLTVRADAATGSGEPGRAFPGRGEGGGDAVVGATGASARVTLALGPADAATAPTLVKRQAVRAPDGSARAVSGAVVTYTLEARFPAAAADARIEDPLPAAAIYLPGTLTLDGAGLTDAADADAGRVERGSVHVLLGDAAQGATRTVTFQVRLP